jgi:hypothetical protein
VEQLEGPAFQLLVERAPKSWCGSASLHLSATSNDRLRFYTDIVVISRVLTVALSAPFNVITRLIEIFKMTFFLITGPLGTEANRLDGQKKYDEVKSLFFALHQNLCPAGICRHKCACAALARHLAVLD